MISSRCRRIHLQFPDLNKTKLPFFHIWQGFFQHRQIRRQQAPRHLQVNHSFQLSTKDINYLFTLLWSFLISVVNLCVSSGYCAHTFAHFTCLCCHFCIRIYLVHLCGHVCLLCHNFTSLCGNFVFFRHHFVTILHLSVFKMLFVVVSWHLCCHFGFFWAIWPLFVAISSSLWLFCIFMG